MIRRGVRIQLIVFGIIALGAVVMLLVRFAGLGEILAPSYTVKAELADAGGLFPRAEVNLLGTAVGSVRDVTLEPHGTVVAALVIDHGVRIPTDVTATVAHKSAIGEQYVELTPRAAGGPVLVEGSVIPASRTRTPLPVEELLGNLNALAASVPKQALDTNLTELARALGGAGPDLHRLVEQSDALTHTALANAEDMIKLIETGATVLDTQVARGAQIGTFSEELAGLTQELRALNPTFVETFENGAEAASQLTGLLRDNEEAIPTLLANLLTVTDVAHARQPHIRKTLAVLPWTLEKASQAVRYCDKNDPTTGEPIPSSCHYDAQGRPKYFAHFAAQLVEKPVVSDPYNVCVRGYEGTKRFLPNGAPADGVGPPERPDQPPNNEARCTAPPTDRGTPNVRGAQNAQRPHAENRARPGGAPVQSPHREFAGVPVGPAPRISGTGAQAPPAGTDGLSWLLTAPMRAGGR